MYTIFLVVLTSSPVSDTNPHCRRRAAALTRFSLIHRPGDVTICASAHSAAPIKSCFRRSDDGLSRS